MAALDMLDKLGVKVRLVNVVDLLSIQNASENDKAMSDEKFVELFTADKPVLFAFHAYPRPRIQSPHLGPSEPRQLQRPRLQGAGLHDHAVRHGPRERHGPLGARGRRAAHGRSADKWSEQIGEWENFRVEAFQFAVDNGYDHPAFTDWKWRDASDAGEGVSATQATAGDNE